jgi:ParB/RepB/Spo0J family partition protein
MYVAKAKERKARGKKRRDKRQKSQAASQTTAAETMKLPSAKLVHVNPGIIKAGPNARSVDESDPDFIDLCESVKASGVVIPVHVRQLADGDLERIAGARRVAAALKAGCVTIPALDHGIVSDDDAFLISFLENAPRRDLSPMEAGKACDMLLARHNEDVAAVASRLGKTKYWVATHAQIERGLIVEWKKAAVENDRFERWTAEHWVQIARRPAAMQQKDYTHLTGGNCYGAKDWTVKRLEEELKGTQQLLAKAPFDTTKCQQCPNRTGVNAFLWKDDEAEASGEKDRCLDGKCWQRKAAAAQKLEVTQAVDEWRGNRVDAPQVIPISTIEVEDRWPKSEKYREKIRPVRKVFPNVLEADAYQVVAEPKDPKKAKGAVPAIVVAGKGKGSIKWVKVAKKEESQSSRSHGSGRPAAPRETPEEIARRKRESDIECEVADRVQSAIRTLSPAPELPLVIGAMLGLGLDVSNLYGKEQAEFRRDFGAAIVAGNATEFVRDFLWADFAESFMDGTQLSLSLDEHKYIGGLFNIDLVKIEAEVRKELEPKPEVEPTIVKLDPDKMAELGIETLNVPLDAKSKAKIEIFVGEKDGVWAAGCKGHIPGAGLDQAYPATGGCPTRQAALAEIAGHIIPWLESKPGRKSYKHYEAIAEAVRVHCRVGGEATLSEAEPVEPEANEEVEPDGADGDAQPEV